MSCNFFTPVQICNISKDMEINSRILSRMECPNNINLEDIRPISTRCCNYINPVYNCLASSCCFKNKYTNSISQTKLNKLKDGNNYKASIAETELKGNIYSKIDFKTINSESKSTLSIKNKDICQDYKLLTNNQLLGKYEVSNHFRKDMLKNNLFNNRTKK